MCDPEQGQDTVKTDTGSICVQRVSRQIETTKVKSFFRVVINIILAIFFDSQRSMSAQDIQARVRKAICVLLPRKPMAARKLKVMAASFCCDL